MPSLIPSLVFSHSLCKCKFLICSIYLLPEKNLGTLLTRHICWWWICSFCLRKAASLVAQRLKRLPAMRETWVRSLGWEDPLEKEMATHSSILAWRIPWTEEPGGLQFTGSKRVGYDWATSLFWSEKVFISLWLSWCWVVFFFYDFLWNTWHKIKHFKVTSSVALNIFIIWCSHLLWQVSKHFFHSFTPLTHCAAFPVPPPPGP